MDNSTGWVIAFGIGAILVVISLGVYIGMYDAIYHPHQDYGSARCGTLYQMDNQHRYQLRCSWDLVP